MRLHSLFFFSSRRRHTRSLCDWSSDVCSSDLTKPLQARIARNDGFLMGAPGTKTRNRSEERRVGKECRSRGSTYHCKENRRLVRPCKRKPSQHGCARRGSSLGSSDLQCHV